MAAIETSRVAPFGSVAIFRAVEFVEGVVKAVNAKFVADRTYRELSKLSPAQLRDIGLGEHDLADFANDVARRAR